MLLLIVSFVTCHKYKESIHLLDKNTNVTIVHIRKKVTMFIPTRMQRNNMFFHVFLLFFKLAMEL